MFFDEVHLSKNHWSFRLLHFVFPSVQRFNNFCPHFWLTILAVFTLPFALLLKGFIVSLNIILKPLEMVSNVIYKFLREREKVAFHKLTEEEQKIGIFLSKNYYFSVSKYRRCERQKLYKLSSLYSACSDKSRYENLDIKFRGWGEDNEPYTSTELEILKKLDTLLPEKEEPKIPISQRLEIAKTNHKTATVTLMWIAKYIAAPILGIIAAVLSGIILYYFILLLGWIWYWIVFLVSSKDFVSYFFTALAMIAVVLLFLWILVFSTRKTIEYFMYNSVDPKACQRKRRFFKTLFSPFIFVWNLLSSGAKFLWLGFKTFKSNNCPAIIWEDEKK